ncbi:MAG: fructose-6-phosphate aldolase [Candidatus Micrarchaeia archaeon]|jgi:transaldolase
MKLFIDTANIEEIKIASRWGVIAGVTTNPSLIAKEGKDFKEVVGDICKLIDCPISAEVTALTAPEMIKQGKEISKWHKNIVIKIPLNEEGIIACKALSDAQIKTNVTLCFSANQAILAALAGATYVSPFIGRLDDINEDGMQLIADIRQIYSNYGYKTQILAASIRHPVHITKSALLGADVATVPFKVLQMMFKHPLTDAGLKKFMEDWEKLQKK